MDPDTNLREQRQLAAKIIKSIDADRPVHEADVDRLCELVLALDEWIYKGGFVPKRWS